MKSKPSIPADIDEYIAGFPKDIQALLKKVRATIRHAAPRAGERISYRVPAYTQEGNLVYFAAFKNHIGFFPTSSGIRQFKQELSDYNGSKGSVRFPFDRPIPFDLIARIVKFRVEENLEKAAAKMRRPASRRR